MFELIGEMSGPACSEPIRIDDKLNTVIHLKFPQR
ncbi:hypothetical protein HNR31_003403 [Anoxybacillus caldiproteolyticus]|uniref:Uncharacterized protein n=1 Tax=Thermaerobacillus caldiproteolyticus TaxID=247480 RepID=A0A7V9Z9R6_9BACL|nr:hypothetical protein [Anoxybacillus caldiproteolyticus]